MFFTHQNNKITLSLLYFDILKTDKRQDIIMQLAVIDDLIQESKSQIGQSEPCTQLENNKNLCVRLCWLCFSEELISKADYEDFKPDKRFKNGVGKMENLKQLHELKTYCRCLEFLARTNQHQYRLLKMTAKFLYFCFDYVTGFKFKTSTRLWRTPFCIIKHSV